MPSMNSGFRLEFPSPDRSAAINSACRNAVGVPFEPPELDPNAEITNDFLRDLATCCTVSEQPSEHVEQLACEVSHYFRRPPQEMQDSLEAAWRSRARHHSSTGTVCDHLSRGVARTFFELRHENERLVFCYGDLSRIEGKTAHPLPDSWLLGLELPDQSNRRAIVIVCGRESKILWESQSPLKLTRTPGLFLDDARITGGNWHLTTVSTAVTSDLAVSGSLRGGRFHTWFKELLMFSNEDRRSETMQ